MFTLGLLSELTLAMNIPQVTLRALVVSVKMSAPFFSNFTQLCLAVLAILDRVSMLCHVISTSYSSSDLCHHLLGVKDVFSLFKYH